MYDAIWQNLLKLAPWLLFGTFVAALLHVWLPAGFAKRRFTGRGGVFRAVLFGVPLPLCSCGVVPTGIGLKKEGASDGAAVGFLISTPQTGVDSKDTNRGISHTDSYPGLSRHASALPAGLPAQRGSGETPVK